MAKHQRGGRDPLSADIEARLRRVTPKQPARPPHRGDPQFWLLLIIALVAVGGVIATLVGLRW